MRPSKQEIQNILREAETLCNLRENVLSEVYNAEARVVFMGRRRGITGSLRRIIRDAIKKEVEKREN